MLLAATGVIGHFLKEYRDDIKDQYERENDLRDPYDFGQYGRYEFFLYTTCVGVIIAIMSLVWTFIEKDARGMFFVVSLNGCS